MPDIIDGDFYAKFKALQEYYPDSSEVPLPLLKSLQAEYSMLEPIDGLEKMHVEIGIMLSHLVKSKEATN